MPRDDWCLIESDPAVFTEMIRGFGVSGVEVQEVFSFTDLSDQVFKKVYGVIFLFGLFPDADKKDTPLPDPNVDVYFSQQVVTNACATQALINLLMNCDPTDVELGQILAQFKSFTANMDPSTRGLCLSNSEEIRTVHNSFGCPLLLEWESPESSDQQKPYHFITYVPKGGHVFEMDGLMAKPVDLGVVPPDGDWLKVVQAHVRRKIEKYNAEEIRFNMMAVVPDRKMELEKQLQLLIEKNDQRAIRQVKDMICTEQTKKAYYQSEVNRYRHNYVPFIVELMKILAENGKLSQLISEIVEDAKAHPNDYRDSD